MFVLSPKFSQGSRGLRWLARLQVVFAETPAGKAVCVLPGTFQSVSLVSNTHDLNANDGERRLCWGYLRCGKAVGVAHNLFDLTEGLSLLQIEIFKDLAMSGPVGVREFSGSRHDAASCPGQQRKRQSSSSMTADFINHLTASSVNCFHSTLQDLPNTEHNYI